MKQEQLFEAIGHADDVLLARCQPPENARAAARRKKTARLLVGAAAACLLLTTALFLIPKLSAKERTAPNMYPLSDASRGVSVRAAENLPDSATSAALDLVWLTEEEIFSRFDIVIFEGTVTAVQNIVIDFNGDKDYRAIASIQVEKVFRGGCAKGSTIEVLLPCPIDADGVWTEDTGVISQLRAGTHGIFMPAVYGSESFYEKNGARLLLTDIVSYGFMDGERFAFLEGGDGVVFARWAYESIADASSLSEIEAYIESMLNRSGAE